METDYIKFKFNGGNGAVLCSNCSKIIMSGSKIPDYIWDAVCCEDDKEIKNIAPMFCCDKCKEEYYKKKVEKK